MKIFKFIKFFIKILFLKTVVKSKDKKNDKLILIEIDKCNFCNSKNLNLLYSYKCKIYNYIFNVFECISCGHGFIGNPPNSNTLIEKYYSYDDNMYYSRDAITMSPEDRSIEQLFNQMMDEKREKKIKNLNNQNKEKFKIIEKYIEEYKEYKSVLEIGCMHGEF